MLAGDGVEAAKGATRANALKRLRTAILFIRHKQTKQLAQTR